VTNPDVFYVVVQQFSIEVGQGKWQKL